MDGVLFCISEIYIFNCTFGHDNTIIYSQFLRCYLAFQIEPTIKPGYLFNLI